MRCTDACVYPYPLGDSTVRRMAQEAGELGFDSMVAVGARGCTYKGVEVVGGTIIQGRDQREVQAAMRRIDGNPGILMATAGDYTLNRALLHVGRVRVLQGIHATPKNSFDHILSKMAAERQVAVDLDLSLLVSGRDYARQKALQRYADLAGLQSRFGFPFTLSSGARSILQMKSTRDMVALCGLFGLDEDGVGGALLGIAKILRPEKAVEVVE
ncbi:MAG: Ribonuclease P protein component 3 [Methanoregulaceae archaeon PtaB.Bin009]|nr:MAG: Ribonuclease P protein component 3 [Methanoregulaceae archaeon PtaB.Bin009]